MRSRIALLACALATPALGQSSYFMNGNVLYQRCISRDVQDAVYCLGFVAASLDMINLHVDALNGIPPYCAPEKVTVKQATDVVTAYLATNPKDRHQVAAALVTLAVREAWPCR